jgi:di/tricarboxylate transporter
VKLDVLFFALFGALLACLLSNFFGLAPQYFTANFGIFIWPCYCGLLFLLYVQFQDRALRASPLRYLAFLGRVLLVFLISVAVAVALDYGCGHRTEASGCSVHSFFSRQLRLQAS